MNDQERYEARRAYFRAYAAANRERRRLANERWREKDRLAYNARQKAANERWRRAHGIQPRPPAMPKPPKKVNVPKPKPLPKPEPKIVAVPREVIGLAARFAAYRMATRRAA